jgi:hypothetical protein
MILNFNICVGKLCGFYKLKVFWKINSAYGKQLWFYMKYDIFLLIYNTILIVIA